MTQQQYPQGADPLDQPNKRPAVSFKNQPIGTSFTGTVIEPAQLVQSRDYDTDEPAFWPDGNPKMAAVIGLMIDGEERSLWASKPSAMLRALSDAQREAGTKISNGGTLTITFTGEQPNDRNPKMNPQKLYRVDYTPADPLAQDQQQAAPQYESAVAMFPTGTQTAAPGPQQPQQVIGDGHGYANAAAGPSQEQIAAVRSAGLDPDVVFGGKQSPEPPF